MQLKLLEKLEILHLEIKSRRRYGRFSWYIVYNVTFVYMLYRGTKMEFKTKQKIREFVILSLAIFGLLIASTLVTDAEATVIEVETPHTSQYINNVKVVVGDRQVLVETRGGKHIYSEDCIDHSCNLYNSIIEEPYIEVSDGVVKPNAVLTEVNLANANKLKRIDNILFFVVNRVSASGLYWTVEKYYVDTKHLSVVVQKTSQDVYKHGLPDPRSNLASK